jgi:hypothetical protein
MDELYKGRVREYLSSSTNPMRSTPEIVRHVTGVWYNSTDREYVKFYLLLEEMCRENSIFCCGVKNGGNVYILRDRIIAPFVNATANKYQEAINLDNLP